MGKLAIISDLHADINHFETIELNILLNVLREHAVTWVHFAGDSANKMQRTLEINQIFRLSGIETTFNLGNHEMADIQGEEMIEHYPDSHFLNLRYLPLNEKKVLLGLNGWYDYGFSQNQNVAENITIKNRYWYDRMITREGNDQEVTQRMLRELKPILDELAEKNYQVVIATHFVPQPAFIVQMTGEYAVWNKMNAFLGAASLGRLLDQYDNIEQVAFGHTHRRFPDMKINGTNYSCRPFGYFYEWQLTRNFILSNQLADSFVPMKMRRIIRDHQKAFDQYKHRYLAEEFAACLTLVDY